MTEIIIRTNVLDGENQGVTFMNGCTWNDLHTGNQGFTIDGGHGFGVCATRWLQVRAMMCSASTMRSVH